MLLILADAQSGSIGDIVESNRWITCNDEWMSVIKVQINSRYAEVLRTDVRLDDERD